MRLSVLFISFNSSFPWKLRLYCSVNKDNTAATSLWSMHSPLYFPIHLFSLIDQIWLQEGVFLSFFFFFLVSLKRYKTLPTTVVARPVCVAHSFPARCRVCLLPPHFRFLPPLCRLPVCKLNVFLLEEKRKISINRYLAALQDAAIGLIFLWTHLNHQRSLSFFHSLCWNYEVEVAT